MNLHTEISGSQVFAAVVALEPQAREVPYAREVWFVFNQLRQFEGGHIAGQSLDIAQNAVEVPVGSLERFKEWLRNVTGNLQVQLDGQVHERFGHGCNLSIVTLV